MRIGVASGRSKDECLQMALGQRTRPKEASNSIEVNGVQQDVT
jgi:hypothetical protein